MSIARIVKCWFGREATSLAAHLNEVGSIFSVKPMSEQDWAEKLTALTKGAQGSAIHPEELNRSLRDIRRRMSA